MSLRRDPDVGYFVKAAVVMVLEILLIISVVLQIVAAIVAIGLTRRTKYNLSWMLFTVALTCMAFLRMGEYFQITSLKTLRLPKDFFVWMGVVTSLCFAVGMLLVQKIFKYISGAEKQRRITERRILNTVLRTEEKERLRFSKDLHDGLGPLLSSAKMSVSALSAGNGDERSREILQNASYVIDEAIRSLREISVNLSPHILNDFGLSRAISNFINKLPRSGMQILFSTNLRGERFDMDIEVILYRVVCELINNSLKHSGATEASISLVRVGSLIRLDYRDNGRGFDTGESQAGMGIANIHSRVSSLKGECALESRPGHGMKAIIEVPI